MAKRLFLFLLWCCAARAVAATFSVQPLAAQSQLPVSNIIAVYQDSEGFMWYGTIGGGLCRDNGYQIHLFRPSQCALTPAADNVLCIAEDSAGNIWMGTDAGLFRLERKSMTLSMPHRLTQPVYAIAKSHDGSLWMEGGRTLCRLSADGDSLLERLPQIPKWRVTNFYETRDHRLFALLSGQLAELAESAGRHTLVAVSTSRPFDPVCMRQDADGECWIATWGDGVVHFDPATGETTPQPVTTRTVDQSQCLSMAIDRLHGLMWVATNDNLYAYRIEGRRLVPYDTGQFLSRDAKILGVLYEDRSGNIWVPGFIPSTFVIRPQRSNMRRIPIDEMRSQVGYPLIPDRMVMCGNRAWIHQGRVGLMYCDLQTGRLSRAGNSDYSQCIAREKSGRGLLAADGNKLVRFPSSAPTTATELATFKERITHIVDRGEEILYVGTRRALYAYSQAGGQIQRLCSTEAPVGDICVAGSDLYFVVQERGLYRIGIHGGDSARLLLPSAFLSSIALNRDGVLWAVGRDGGVYSLRGDTVEMQRDMQNEANEPLIDVACDHRGHVWTLSNQRAKEFNPQSRAFRSISNSELGVEYFFRYEEADGDSIGIGGTGAFCIFASTPELDRPAASQQRPRVTSILIGDSVRLCDSELCSVEIPWEQSTVGFSLSTLDVLNARHIRFAYRIDELKTDWIYLPQGVNTLYVNSLPYGRCHLRLRATDASGCWQGGEGEILLRHLRPWWQRWWAVALFALLSSLPLYCLWLAGKRLRKLRRWHKQRRELALTEIAAPTQQELLAAKEKEFLKAARDCIERHLDDPQYNVESLAADLCMSRSNLHRRLHPIAGMSPVEFLRDIRLKHAAQILADSPGLPVAEVARRVGFGTPGYFSKCFKERFGVLPTQWPDATNVAKE